MIGPFRISFSHYAGMAKLHGGIYDGEEYLMDNNWTILTIVVGKRNYTYRPVKPRLSWDYELVSIWEAGKGYTYDIDRPNPRLDTCPNCS